MPKGMPDADQPLDGKVLAMIFDKQSTRTRISFDMAARQLGGGTLMLTGNEMQLAREETIADTARVLSRYVDAVMIRLLDHEMVEELAANATIPVINGLTKWSHPCQVMADVMTYEEHKGSITGATVAWSGDGNNVLTSLGACRGEVRLQAECGVAAGNCRWIAETARLGRRAASCVTFGHDPEAAVEGADCVVTDTWVSMGDDNATKRHNLLKPYQVNGALMKLAQEGRHLHALPAGPSRRGSHRRGDRRAAIGGVRRGGKPPARPEGDPGLGVWCLRTLKSAARAPYSGPCLTRWILSRRPMAILSCRSISPRPACAGGWCGWTPASARALSAHALPEAGGAGGGRGCWRWARCWEPR